MDRPLRVGSVIATTNSTGGVDQTYEYEPYGEQINPDPADPNPLRYVGGYHDTDTGLIKFGTRYYMPDLARWTQPDPVLGDFTNPFSLDPYQYVQGDPMNGVDPSGRHSTSTTVGACIFVCAEFGVVSDDTGNIGLEGAYSISTEAAGVSFNHTASTGRVSDGTAAFGECGPPGAVVGVTSAGGSYTGVSVSPSVDDPATGGIDCALGVSATADI